MKTVWFNIILFSAIASQLSAYLLWGLTGNSSYYFFLNAFTHVILWAAFLIALKVSPKPTKNTVKIAVYGLTLAINQFLDEAIFDPTSFQINEQIFLGAIVGHLIVSYFYARKN